MQVVARPARRRSASARGSCASCRARCRARARQISGTSPRPRARAAVAGNSAVRSSVAVKMMLTRSSCAIVVALEHLLHELLGLASSISAFVSSSQVVAPRKASNLTDGEVTRRRPVGARRVRPRTATAPRRASSARQAPGASRGSRSGPMRVRTSRTHGMADRRAHAPHHALAALPSRRSRARARPSSDSCTSRTRAGRVEPVVELDACRASVRSAAGDGTALDLGEVLLLHAVARMHEQLRELAVVREHEQALGVAVEAADREHPRLGRARGRARSARPCGIARGRHVARRLVQQPVHERECRRRPARRRARRGRRAGSTRRPSTATSPLTVTRPAAIELLARAPRARDRRAPAPSAAARPSVEHSSARGEVDVDAASARFACRPRARPSTSSEASAQPAFERLDDRRVGNEVGERRQLVERVEPEPFEEHPRGREQRRVARRVLVADLFDVAARDERLQRRVDVDAADRRQLRARHRLLVRDDRERFERGPDRRAVWPSSTNRSTYGYASGCVWKR